VKPKLKNLVWIVAMIAIAGGWFVAFRPTSMGGQASYVMIRGTSMLPTYVGGDLVIARKAATYGKGDIVAYHVPSGDAGEGIVVIHRIIGGSATEGFMLQGDNNDWRDEWNPKPDDIVGKAQVRIPKLGLVFGFLHAPVPMAALAASLAFVFVLFPKKKQAVAEPDVEVAPPAFRLERPSVLAMVPCVVHTHAKAARTAEPPALTDAA
jgi:signal peptidase I